MKLINLKTLSEQEITFVTRKFDLYYQCRNCGETFLKWSTDRNVYNYETEQSFAAQLISTHGNRVIEHYCKHGTFGVAHLVRVEIE